MKYHITVNLILFTISSKRQWIHQDIFLVCIIFLWKHWKLQFYNWLYRIWASLYIAHLLDIMTVNDYINSQSSPPICHENTFCTRHEVKHITVIVIMSPDDCIWYKDAIIKCNLLLYIVLFRWNIFHCLLYNRHLLNPISNYVDMP
jgi:hypothetical protein